jgi:hypothetical protein
MFFEVIYTRCRQGTDILRKGQSLTSDGYKIYSCTPEVMNDGVVDLPFLANAMQAKQSYNDPDFMDDAYLYYTPDSGKSFLLNFFPVSFDSNAKGDYSHRPGNFINHALVGDFQNIYPYELFRNNKIWTAKGKSEAFYYENTPSSLPVRNDINDSAGHSFYSYEKIGCFIADGRKEAFASAVSFLIAQYKEETDKRKFLLISDDSSEKIELWIAAIECAFSPQIASSIPFATRMDKFLSVNKYTVNQSGAFQIQINLQDPNQKQRYRAMIIGIDVRDKANINASRPLVNSPFALLDGKNKRALFEANTSGTYYDLITKFDDVHRNFCFEFLPIFSISEPTSDITILSDAYIKLSSVSIDVQKISSALEILRNYKISSKLLFQNLYKRIYADVPKYLQENLISALSIINWLLESSSIAGDENADQYFSEVVLKTFNSLIIRKDRNIIKYLIAFFENPALIKLLNEQSKKDIISEGLKLCCFYKDNESGCKIAKLLMQKENIDIQEFLLSITAGNESNFVEFILNIILVTDNLIIESNSSMLSFCNKLKNTELNYLINTVVRKRLNKINNSSEYEQFINAIMNLRQNEIDQLKDIFETIDKKISIFDKNVIMLARQVQMSKPKEAICTNSAHIYIIEILSGKQKYQNLINEFEKLTSQNVPSVKNQEYLELFVSKLLKMQLSDIEQKYIIAKLEVAPIEYYFCFARNLIDVAVKQKETWNNLINSALNNKEKMTNTLIEVLVRTRQNEKSLNTLENMLVDKTVREYFTTIADDAWKKIQQNKQPSIFGKIADIFLKKE